MAIVDVPRDLLTKDQDEVINMTFRGKIAEIMIKTAPEVYRKYFIIEKRKWYYIYIY